MLRCRAEPEQSLATRRAGGVQLGQRAALYCRVSTADQSCARQERDLAGFAARAGYEVVGVYKETASGVRHDRAERRKVMALAQRREIDAVLASRKNLRTVTVQPVPYSVLYMSPLESSFPLLNARGRLRVWDPSGRLRSAGVRPPSS